VPPDLRAGIWIAVYLHRIRERIRTGKAPSVSQACRELVASGGILSVIGGNLDHLEQASSKSKKRWQRFRFDSNGSGVRPDVAGTIFVSHTISRAGTLEARYSEANKLACSDRRVRLAWLNVARQILGRPIKKPRWANPGQKAAWHVGRQGNIVAS
jgi:hypothetical protein